MEKAEFPIFLNITRLKNEINFFNFPSNPPKNLKFPFFVDFLCLKIAFFLQIDSISLSLFLMD